MTPGFERTPAAAADLSFLTTFLLTVPFGEV